MTPAPHSQKRKASDEKAATTTITNVAAATAETPMAPTRQLANTVKKKATTATNVSKKSAKTQAAEAAAGERAALRQEIGYEALTLPDIYDRIVELLRRVPPIPADGFFLQQTTSTVSKSKSSKCAEDEDGDNGEHQAEMSAAATVAVKTTVAESTMPVPAPDCPYDQAAIKVWASALQTVLDEFNLLVAVVGVSTYRWGTDRSGAADQNLNLLSHELHRSQEQIAASVTPRLTDVLSPVRSLLTTKTVTTKLSSSDDDNNGGGVTEVKQNYFCTTLEDPDYVQQCHVVLARNAVSVRHVVLANFDKLLSAVQDYLEATQKDSQHDARGFVF